MLLFGSILSGVVISQSQIPWGCCLQINCICNSTFLEACHSCGEKCKCNRNIHIEPIRNWQRNAQPSLLDPRGCLRAASDPWVAGRPSYAKVLAAAIIRAIPPKAMHRDHYSLCMPIRTRCILQSITAYALFLAYAESFRNMHFFIGICANFWHNWAAHLLTVQ